MPIYRIVLLALCIVGGFHGVNAQPVIPWNPCSFQPEQASAPLEVSPVVSYQGVEWGGRAISSVEAGAVAEIQGAYTLGISSLKDAGHGLTFIDTVDGNGLHCWAGVHSKCAPGKKPIFGLTVDMVSDDVYIHGKNFYLELNSWSKYRATGMLLDAKMQRGHATLLGHAGLYAVTLDGERYSDVGTIGCGASMPWGKRVRAQLQLSSFSDNYQGRYITYEIKAGVSFQPNAHSSIAVGGSYYPKGTPPAGTPFSAASAIGATFDDEFFGAIRSSSFGNLSLTGQLRF